MDLEKLQKTANIHHRVQDKILNYLDNQEKTHIDLFLLKKFIKSEILTELYKENIFIKNPENWNGRHYNCGLAFPICLSVDNIAAHYSPNKSVFFDATKSIIKIDYGLHINGNIVDSAFNYTLNEDLKLLDNYSIEATNIAIKESRIDSNIFDIGSTIEEFINSLEININNKEYQVKSFNDLCGHKIGLYKVHDNIPFPNVDVYKRNIIDKSSHYRLKEGDCFAIEPYLTTGNAVNVPLSDEIINNNPILSQDKESKDFHIYNFDYHKIINYSNVKKHIGPTIYKESLPKFIPKYLDKIQKKFYFLPFELSELPDNKINYFKILLKHKLFEEHNIVADIKNSYIAQTEKNIYVGSSKTIEL